MSWWVSLFSDKEKMPVTVEKFEAGGTRLVGGSTAADLNVTYNYSALISEAMKAAGYSAKAVKDSLWTLDDMDGREGANFLRTLIEILEEVSDKQAHKLDGTRREVDSEIVGGYWEATVENVLDALKLLRQWGLEHPSGTTWKVT